MADSKPQEKTGVPLNVQRKLLMIMRGMIFPSLSRRWPDSMMCATSVLIWMISPFFASLGSLMRGFSAITISCFNAFPGSLTAAAADRDLDLSLRGQDTAIAGLGDD